MWKFSNWKILGFINFNVLILEMKFRKPHDLVKMTQLTSRKQGAETRPLGF